jgi:hypothetical protein
MKVHRRRRKIALLFFNINTRWGWVVNAIDWMLYPQE